MVQEDTPTAARALQGVLQCADHGNVRSWHYCCCCDKLTYRAALVFTRSVQPTKSALYIVFKHHKDAAHPP